MRIENTVEVDAPLDRVWALVNDIPRVAPCMPGAALTGVLDDDTYEGTVAVKLGPLRMSYKGKVVVEGVDEANHSAHLAASGRDTKGAGTARANVETRLEAVDPTRTRLHVTSDVQLTGKVASFGRGGAINDVASRLFGQFADCLRTTLESEPAAAASAEGAGVGAGQTGASADAAPPSEPVAAGEDAPTSASADAGPPSETVAAGDATTTAGAGAATAPATTGIAAQPAAGTGQPPATTPGAAPGTPVPPPPPRAAEALDAGSLVGTVIKGRLTALFQAIAGFFRRLFGRRSTS
jgi:carbon monoxide dehydrogenase subunit G